MKVYLLYSNYDDGSIYDSVAYSTLMKIVDSEGKAKQWIFEHARDLVNNWIAQDKERLNGFLLIDEDGPYYEPFVDGRDDDLKQEIMDDIQGLEHLIPEFNPYVKTYVLYPDGREEYSFSYEEMEVE